MLVVAGIEAACVGAWLVRGDEDGGGDDDRPPTHGPRDARPWDWTAFDRARAGWGRRPGRPRAGV